MLKTLLSTFLFFTVALCSEQETFLRNTIFTGYNKNVRPMKNFSEPIHVNVGLAVQNIESFNQIQETMELNIWLRKYWTNEYLSWNTSISNVSQLTLDSYDAWTPDIELLNAATKPDIYTLKGGMYLYQDGQFLWSMPAIYKFSCSLQLEYFPFDTQDCSMRFGSWTYDNTMLILTPYGDTTTQIDVLDSFSHSEWELLDYSVMNLNETRDCCGSKTFSINEYSFKFKRFTHYYKLNMGMTISLVIVSFIIMLVKPDNLSRTGTAVFIPLTILALQLTIADKIPVVGYYTLMDQFFLTCFIASMMVSIESGIIYTVITSNSQFILSIFSRFINIDDVLIYKHNQRQRRKNIQDKHDLLISQKKRALFPIVNRQNTTNTTNIMNSNNDDFNITDGILMSVIEKESNIDELISMTRSPSYKDGINGVKCPKDNSLRQRHTTNKGIESNDIDLANNEFIEDNTIVEKDITKTINFDNTLLSLTYKEHIMFEEITRRFIIVDNVFRVLLPLTFFIIIIILFSNE